MEPPAWAPEDSLMEASEASEREGSDGHEGQSFLSDSNAELVALCEGVQIHTRAEHDDEYDAFFAYEKSTAESDGYKKRGGPGRRPRFARRDAPAHQGRPGTLAAGGLP